MGNNLTESILNKVKLNSWLCAAIIGFIIHTIFPISSIFDMQALSYYAIIPLFGWLIYTVVIYLLIELGCHLFHKRKDKICAYDKGNSKLMRITYEIFTIEMPANRFRYKV